MLMVLSPAKALDMSASPAMRGAARSEPAMVAQTAQLLPVVKKLGAPGLKKLMGLSPTLASLNATRYSGFEKQTPKQACLAFDGPAFRGLKAEDFSPKEQAFAQKHLRILSGLYGVLRPYDNIKPYRLEMGSKLATSRGKTLYDFWGDAITQQLGNELNAKPRLLVNCASQEYWKSVRPARLPAGVQVVTCDFPGASVFSKKARGLMCRHIIKRQVTTVDGLRTFVGEDVDRYAFNAAKSSPTKLVFVRLPAGQGGVSKGTPGKPRSKANTAPVTKKRAAITSEGIRGAAKKARK